ncbi:MAG: extracellular solute-binding protein [Fusobacteriaceae bacterium]|nr:extracellular solute-binding protein [Fusobacteriaceae bacterium]MBP6712956.1 extracellular solute-binding protein [Aliarcobacter sp.]
MLKKVSLLLLSLFVLMFAVSCGGEKEAVKSEEAVSIDVWLTPQWKGVFSATEAGADFDSFLKKAAEEFKKENPNVTVNVQVIPGDQRSDKLSVAIQTKTLPDVFFESAFAMTQYAHMGALAPIDDIIDDAAKKDIPQAIWDNVQIGGKTYFYPFANNPGTLAYNADLFKKAGLEKYIGGEYDIKTWTLEEYKMILKTLKEKLPADVSPMSLYAKNNQGDTWNLAYLRMFGTPFFGPDGKLVANDDATVKALTLLDEFRKAGYTNTGAETLTSNDVLALFQNQKTAINFVNSVLLTNIQKDMADGKIGKFDLRLANIPGEKAPASFTYVTGACVFNTGNEAKMAMAKKFVQFFSTNAELVKASKNGIPVRDSVATAVSAELPYLKAYQENAKYIFNFSNNTPGYAELRTLLFPELQAVFTGQKTPKEAMDSYTQQGNVIIDREQKNSVALN